MASYAGGASEVKADKTLVEGGSLEPDYGSLHQKEKIVR